MSDDKIIDLGELKRLLKNKAITEIEDLIKSNLNQIRMFLKGAIEALFYLERTGRFKENPRYKKSTFADYIKYEFSLNENGYHKLRFAFFTYPKESLKYGPEVITAIQSHCGTAKIKKVLAVIEKKDKELKHQIVNEQIKEIINKHALPKQLPKSKVDFEQKYEIERKLRVETDGRYKKAMEQIGRLKPAYIEIKEKYKKATEQIEQLESENQELLAFKNAVVASIPSELLSSPKPYCG